MTTNISWVKISSLYYHISVRLQQNQGSESLCSSKAHKKIFSYRRGKYHPNGITDLREVYVFWGGCYCGNVGNTIAVVMYTNVPWLNSLRFWLNKLPFKKTEEEYSAISGSLLTKEPVEWGDRTDWKNAGKNAKSKLE